MIAKEKKTNQKQFLKERKVGTKIMLQPNFAIKIEMNQILKKKENMENLSQNFRTMVNLPEGIEAGVEVKTETKTQKVVTNVHLPSIRRKTVQVKNRLHLINKGIIQNICLREDKDFASLYRDTKNKIGQNFKLLNIQCLSRGQGTIKQ